MVLSIFPRLSAVVRLIDVRQHARASHIVDDIRRITGNL